VKLAGKKESHVSGVEMFPRRLRLLGDRRKKRARIGHAERRARRREKEESPFDRRAAEGLRCVIQRNSENPAHRQAGQTSSRLRCLFRRTLPLPSAPIMRIAAGCALLLPPRKRGGRRKNRALHVAGAHPEEVSATQRACVLESGDACRRGDPISLCASASSVLALLRIFTDCSPLVSGASAIQ